ncbi:MAG: hypothetical protein HQL13_05895, partial [Candidatus Omnitrophica bacterium]|nr:hypothetical protein [Candidatus Omnitrophota bacterium]
DYLLKQITASLIYPSSHLGKAFWDKVYEQGFRQFGRVDMPINTFNKVWIIPDKATLYQKGNSVFLLDSHLKVMLEEDYLSQSKHNAITRSLNSKIIRTIILPALEKEVNEGANFANLRQMYSGMILAAWYKRALKASVLGQIYADKGKTRGVDQDPKTNELIYQQYLKAYRKGVFNFIKEDIDKYTHESIPRKYFSGGIRTIEYDRSVRMASPSEGDGAMRVMAQEADKVTWNARFDYGMSAKLQKAMGTGALKKEVDSINRFLKQAACRYHIKVNNSDFESVNSITVRWKLHEGGPFAEHVFKDITEIVREDSGVGGRFLESGNIQVFLISNAGLTILPPVSLIPREEPVSMSFDELVSRREAINSQLKEDKSGMNINVLNRDGSPSVIIDVQNDLGGLQEQKKFDKIVDIQAVNRCLYVVYFDSKYKDLRLLRMRVFPINEKSITILNNKDDLRQIIEKDQRNPMPLEKQAAQQDVPLSLNDLREKFESSGARQKLASWGVNITGPNQALNGDTYIGLEKRGGEVNIYSASDIQVSEGHVDFKVPAGYAMKWWRVKQDDAKLLNLEDQEPSQEAGSPKAGSPKAASPETSPKEEVKEAGISLKVVNAKVDNRSATAGEYILRQLRSNPRFAIYPSLFFAYLVELEKGLSQELGLPVSLSEDRLNTAEGIALQESQKVDNPSDLSRAAERLMMTSGELPQRHSPEISDKVELPPYQVYAPPDERPWQAIRERAEGRLRLFHEILDKKEELLKVQEQEQQTTAMIDIIKGAGQILQQLDQFESMIKIIERIAEAIRTEKKDEARYIPLSSGLSEEITGLLKQGKVAGTMPMSVQESSNTTNYVGGRLRVGTLQALDDQTVNVVLDDAGTIAVDIKGKPIDDIEFLKALEGLNTKGQVSLRKKTVKLRSIDEMTTRAMNALNDLGGINFNAAQLSLQVKGEAPQKLFVIDKERLDDIPIIGLIPEIQSIQKWVLER